jgi:hypothetical protein
MKTTAIFLCGMLASAIAFSQKPFPLVRLGSLDKATSDTIRVKAYVFDIYVCPPCPEGAMCKPCIENNFTAVEEKPVDPFKVAHEKRVRVFMERPDSLKVGKQYLFVVRFRNKTTSPEDNLTLISFKPL